MGLILIVTWAIWPDLDSFSTCDFYWIAGGVNLSMYASH